jgi:exosortase/archaeosortase family protein
MVAFAAIVGWADSDPSAGPAAGHVLQPAAVLAAWATAAGLRAMGLDVIRDGTVLYQSGGAAMQIRVGCLGFPMLALLIVAMSAYAAPLRRKCTGIAAGVALLCTLNLLRFVHLFWLGGHQPRAFAFTHDVLWRIILTAAFVGVWFAWRRRSDAASGPLVAGSLVH